MYVDVDIREVEYKKRERGGGVDGGVGAVEQGVREWRQQVSREINTKFPLFLAHNLGNYLIT